MDFPLLLLLHQQQQFEFDFYCSCCGSHCCNCQRKVTPRDLEKPGDTKIQKAPESSQ